MLSNSEHPHKLCLATGLLRLLVLLPPCLGGVNCADAPLEKSPRISAVIHVNHNAPFLCKKCWQRNRRAPLRPRRVRLTPVRDSAQCRNELSGTSSSRRAPNPLRIFHLRFESCAQVDAFYRFARRPRARGPSAPRRFSTFTSIARRRKFSPLSGSKFKSDSICCAFAKAGALSLCPLTLEFHRGL